MYITRLLWIGSLGLEAALLAGCDPETHVRINELQVLGTHNSYHVEPEPDVLVAIAALEPELALSLEYTHLPLAQHPRYDP